MKRLLSLLLIGLAATSAAHAQSPSLVNGVSTVATLLLKSAQPPEAQSETLYVTPATYQSQSFPLKRTPTRKLPRADKGGTEIKALEQYLSGRYAAFQADTTTLLLLPDQEKEFSRLRTYIEVNYALWNTTPYTDEINFYRQHDVLRRRLASAR
ncbi:MAG: hypothetical protein ACRYFX_09250 [Janthinobacterium lividum]